MREKLKSLLFISLIAVLLFTGFIFIEEIFANLRQSVVLKNVEGEVYHRGNGFWIFPGRWSEAEENQILEIGDSIRTGKGHAELYFLAGAQVYIEEDTEVELIKNDAGELEIIRMEMDKGSLVINFYEKVRENLTFEIETPSAIAGVRGTMFMVKVKEGKTEVSVAQGKVQVFNEVDESEISAGNKTNIVAMDKNIEVVPFTPKDKEDWENRKERLGSEKEIQEKVQEIKNQVGLGNENKKEGKGKGENNGQGKDNIPEEISPPEELPEDNEHSEGKESNKPENNDPEPEDENQGNSNRIK